MILGLDISTRCIGVALLNPAGDLKKSLSFFPDKTQSLEKKTKFFVQHLKQNISGDLKKIFIEKPFAMITGGRGNANSTALLLRFNGMISYAIYQLYDIEPELIDVRTVRKNLGIKIPRGIKKNEKKQIVIDYVSGRFPEKFVYGKKRTGNPVDGTDDRADAVVVALYGLDLTETAGVVE